MESIGLITVNETMCPEVQDSDDGANIGVILGATFGTLGGLALIGGFIMCIIFFICLICCCCGCCGCVGVGGGAGYYKRDTIKRQGT